MTHNKTLTIFECQTFSLNIFILGNKERHFLHMTDIMENS